jgi:hypothetical protein
MSGVCLFLSTASADGSEQLSTVVQGPHDQAAILGARESSFAARSYGYACDRQLGALFVSVSTDGADLDRLKEMRDFSPQLARLFQRVPLQAGADGLVQGGLRGTVDTALFIRGFRSSLLYRVN